MNIRKLSVIDILFGLGSAVCLIISGIISIVNKINVDGRLYGSVEILWAGIFLINFKTILDLNNTIKKQQNLIKHYEETTLKKNKIKL